MLVLCDMKILALLFVASFLLTIPPVSSAEVYLYREGETVIDYVQTYKANNNESLIEIARKYDLGYNEIADANPDLEPFVPGEGISVKIPTSWILPDVTSYEGIVINLSEMRLYYFFTEGGSRFVTTFPIGIGKEGNNTPTGNFRVIEKIVNPSWYVPESILIAIFSYLICHGFRFFIFSSNFFAQINSVARIAKPAGITNIAGPGKAIIARPVMRMVNPITIFMIRFACWS